MIDPSARRDIKRGPSRRNVIRTATWSVPAVTLAAAAPSFAASVEACEIIGFTIPVGQEAPAGQTLTLAGADAAGNTYSLVLTSTLSQWTTTAQARVDNGDANWPPVPFTNHNLNTLGNGWSGSETDDGRWDRLHFGFAPASGPAIVLNQRAAVDPELNGGVPLGPDLQTLTFEFSKNGSPYSPTNLHIDVFDITSVRTTPRPNTDPGDGSGWHPDSGPLGWRQNYWDAVGFTVEPTTIAYVGDVGEYGAGAGTGTLSDPYRRSGEHMPTAIGKTVADRFTFAQFPSGAEMQYTNHDNQYGWHFISISGISFEIGDCS